jgi:hypothetical protein
LVDASFAKDAGLVVVAHFEGGDCFGFLALQLGVGGRPHGVEDAVAGDFKLGCDRIVHPTACLKGSTVLEMKRPPMCKGARFILAQNCCRDISIRLNN